MFDVNHIIQSGGLVLLAVFLYSEVGLLLGFFLPGDTLLIAAGIYAKQGKISIAGVILVAALAAIAGDSTAYWIGRKLGPAVFHKEDGVLFRKDHIKKAEDASEKYGPKLLLFAHFLPVIRTFTPLLAGVARMNYREFLTFDVIGDILWATSVTLAGYYVGSRIPGIDKYILLIVVAAVAITSGPTFFQIGKAYYKNYRARSAGKPKSKS